MTTNDERVHARRVALAIRKAPSAEAATEIVLAMAEGIGRGMVALTPVSLAVVAHPEPACQFDAREEPHPGDSVR